MLYTPIYNIVLIMPPKVKENNIIPRNINQSIKTKKNNKRVLILKEPLFPEVFFLLSTRHKLPPSRNITNFITKVKFL